MSDGVDEGLFYGGASPGVFVRLGKKRFLMFIVNVDVTSVYFHIFEFFSLIFSTA